jgi:hypothetical protein
VEVGWVMRKMGTRVGKVGESGQRWSYIIGVAVDSFTLYSSVAKNIEWKGSFILRSSNS